MATVQSATDIEAILRADVQRGYQIASLITPPAYILATLVRRRPITANKFLRATWLGGLSGAGAGAAVGYVEGLNDPPYLRERHQALAYDANRIRADDHSTIGAILFGVLTPALLWKRARAVHLVLGGAGIGSGIGLSAHWYRILTEPSHPKTPSPPSPTNLPADPLTPPATSPPDA